MASKRLLATQALAATIRHANGTGGYNYDLSSTAVTNNGIETIEMRLARPQQFTVRCWDGAAEMDPHNQANTRDEHVKMEGVVSCLVRDAAPETIVEQLNKLIQDVARAVGGDSRLGGTVGFARIGMIDAPTYSPEQKLGYVTVHVAIEYDIDAVSEI